MKKIQQLLLIVIIIGFILPSCKKGDDDPLISFRSRKARLTGEWKLKDGKEEIINNDTTETVYLNGVTAHVVITKENGAVVDNFTDDFTELWIINKDYSFEITKKYSYLRVILSGNWSFNYADKKMKLKNKESFTFKITNMTYNYTTNSLYDFSNTYLGFDCPTLIYSIDKLTNNEIVVSYTGESIYESSIGKTNSTYTFKQEKK